MRRPPSNEHLIAELRDKLEKANETILQLQQLFLVQSGGLYGSIKLSPNQQTVLIMILAADGICSNESLYTALYGSEQVYQPDRKILREMLRVIRKQLRPHEIEIKNVFGKGYVMPDESKIKLRALAGRTINLEYFRRREIDDS